MKATAIVPTAVFLLATLASPTASRFSIEAQSARAVDSSPAHSVQLRRPWGVAVDAAGALFIADAEGDLVRKIAPDGRVSIVAGIGFWGFSGDGGPATSAALNWPAGVAVDPAGNVFIADTRNHRIRRVTPAGTISTVAGTGVAGFGGDGGPATAAVLNRPIGIAVGPAGGLLIADTENHRVRHVTGAGVVQTIAGSGVPAFGGDGGAATSARLRRPTGVVADNAGNVFIADLDNHRVRKVSASGVITTVAGTGVSGFGGDGGPATSAQLSQPSSLAFDATGNLLIADLANHRVRSVMSDGAIGTLAGNGRIGMGGDGGPAVLAELNQPAGVVVDAAGNTFIADYVDSSIRKISRTGVISALVSPAAGGFSGDGGPAVSARLRAPSGLAMDAAGNLFIADRLNYRVRKVSPSGAIATVAGTGSRGSGADGGLAVQAQLWLPGPLVPDARGNLYIADGVRVRRVSLGGIITTVAGTGKEGYRGDGGPALDARLGFVRSLAIDAAGNLYIGHDGIQNYRVRMVAPNGVITTVAGLGPLGFSGDGGPAVKARIGRAEALAVDLAGSLLIALPPNIRRVTQDGVITTVAGTPWNGRWSTYTCAGRTSAAIAAGRGDGGPAPAAWIPCVSAMAMDLAANLFIADVDYHVVRKIGPGGVITTVVGNGLRGAGGDGGPATSAELDRPCALTVDATGNLFIADEGTHRVRKVTPQGVISTVAGGG